MKTVRDRSPITMRLAEFPSRLLQLLVIAQRWARNRPLRRYERQKYPIYWKLSRWCEQRRFSFLRWVFSIRMAADGARESSSVLAQIGRAIARDVLFSIGLLVVLEVLERYVVPGLPFVWRVLGAFRYDNGALVSLLSTLAQISGVFVGLYFTAICTITSAVYVRVPSDVRRLMLSEKTGNIYIRIVSYLGVLSIASLVLVSTDYNVGSLTIAVTALLGVLSLFSFAVLSARVFEFYDPSLLAQYGAHQIAKCMTAVSGCNAIGRDPSFQVYFQRRAESLLETYTNIVKLAAQPDYAHLTGGAIHQLGSTTVSLIAHYSRAKSTIPSASHWFRKEYKQANWLTADSTKLYVAVLTTTSIQAEAANDFHWADNALTSIAKSVLECLAERWDLVHMAQLGDHMQKVVGILAEEGHIDDALQLLDAMAKVADARVLSQEVGAESNRELSKTRLAFSLLDMHVTGVLQLLLGFGRHLERCKADRWLGALDVIRWPQPGSIYRTPVPPIVFTQLEFIAPRMVFEFSIEGQVVTPRWYSAQTIAQKLTEDVPKRLTLLLDVLGRDVLGRAESLIRSGRPMFAVLLIVKGLEACRKARIPLSGAESLFVSLSEVRRLTDMPWTQTDLSISKVELAKHRESLLLLLASLTPKLIAEPANDKLPDFFGHAYTLLANEVFSAMLNGRVELFETLFPAFFELVWVASKRMGSSYEHSGGNVRSIYVTEPIAELFDLSGFALIFSELNEKPFWDRVVNVWDHWIMANEDPVGTCRYLSGVARYRDSLLMITPRFEMRSQWRTELLDELRQRGLIDDKFFEPFSRRTRSSHRSAVIECISRQRFSNSEAHVFFLAEYLYARKELAGEAMPRSVRSLIEELQDRREGAQDEEDDV